MSIMSWYFILLVCILSGVSSSGRPSRPRRSWIVDSFSIEEASEGPFPYELGRIDIARDYSIYFDLFGEGVDQEPKGVLSLDKATGTVYVHKAVDYEEWTKLKLRFEAKNTDLSFDTKLGIEISILDINDNPPRFQKDLYEISIQEEEAQGSHLLAVLAYDRDQRDTPNSTFHYEIKSVSPKPADAEFFINNLGAIAFKGCLNYEEASRYIIIVEAKDHGEVVSLSSSTTVVVNVQDGNNHLPTITGQRGNGQVKEGEIGASPVQIQVMDRDTKYSPAWRAKYTIHGDQGSHFNIKTDPDTNDGILTVVKPLDYEEVEEIKLSISVDNEVPFFSCKVQERTSSGLWKLYSGPGFDSGQLNSVKVVIRVEDSNDPPVFAVGSKESMLEENVPPGTWVDRVTATDHDSMHASSFVYSIGSDPTGWLKVDPHTGDITTVKIPDREDPRVVNGVFSIVLHAVDDGVPPMTGSATLLIHVMDKNDNLPQLTTTHMDVCVSNSPTLVNITAFDLDDSPFGGPFKFELLGDVEGKWSLKTSYGYTVGLVTGHGVYAGQHMVDVKISDLQDQFAIHSISVTACDCSITTDCRAARQITKKVDFAAIGPMCASLLIVLFMLLMVIVISCKREFTTIMVDKDSDETLLASNTECPGRDCEVADGVIKFPCEGSEGPSLQRGLYEVTQDTYNIKDKEYFHYSLNTDHRIKHSYWLYDEYWRKNIRENGYYLEDQAVDSSSSSLYRGCVLEEALSSLLQRRLSSIMAKEEHLGDHQPHLYNDEGDPDHLSELDPIITSDHQLDLGGLKDLDARFNDLASICLQNHEQLTVIRPTAKRDSNKYLM